MEAWLLLLVVLLFLVNYLPELNHYLRKGIAEFCQGLRWYQAELDDEAAIWLFRGLVATLGNSLARHAGSWYSRVVQVSGGPPARLSQQGDANMILAYEEFVDFLAGGTTPQGVIDFRPSEATKARVTELIRHQKTTPLSADETAELNQYLQIEHLMRLAKARARQHLAAG